LIVKFLALQFLASCNISLIVAAGAAQAQTATARAIAPQLTAVTDSSKIATVKKAANTAAPKVPLIAVAPAAVAASAHASSEPSVMLMLNKPKAEPSEFIQRKKTTIASASLTAPGPTVNAAAGNEKDSSDQNLLAQDNQAIPLSAPLRGTSGNNSANVMPKLQASAEYPFAPEGTQRRALPAPLDAVFPSTEYIGVAGQTQIGVPNLNPVFPLEKAIYHACPILKKARIEIYGWTNAGWDHSTSHHSNIPLSYAIVPNKPELDQQVFRIDRMPDTVQQSHSDWGMRLSMVYGIDTRYTVSTGWYPASGQVLAQNRLYSWDPVECYGVFYLPKIKEHKLFDGLVIKYGRYISPSDIEAQLAPDNYLWTHSLMFTVDNYTQTGIFGSLKLNKQWMVQAGIHAGDDIAPWSPAAIPSGIACARWQSKTNNDSLYFTLNSQNNGHYRLADKNNGLNGHDNLQQYNITWGHRFSRRVHMMTEAYYLYEINALEGGTVTKGPPKPYDTNVGPGKLLPGFSPAWGVVNYTNVKITDHDYITFRPIDYLGDPRGLRTGYPTTYASWTVGWCHRFNDLLCIRPEIRYERSLNKFQGASVTPYDNGQRMYQFTFGADIIQRF